MNTSYPQGSLSIPVNHHCSVFIVPYCGEAFIPIKIDIQTYIYRDTHTRAQSRRHTDTLFTWLQISAWAKQMRRGVCKMNYRHGSRRTKRRLAHRSFNWPVWVHLSPPSQARWSSSLNKTQTHLVRSRTAVWETLRNKKHRFAWAAERIPLNYYSSVCQVSFYLFFRSVNDRSQHPGKDVF